MACQRTQGEMHEELTYRALTTDLNIKSREEAVDEAAEAEIPTSIQRQRLRLLT